VLEVRAPEVSRQRMASVLAAVCGNPRRVTGFLPAGREKGQRALIVEENIRGPADLCTGASTVSKVSLLHRSQVFVEAAELLEDVPGEEARRLQVPDIHRALEGADLRPVAPAEAALRHDDRSGASSDLLDRLLDHVLAGDHVSIDEADYVSRERSRPYIALQRGVRCRVEHEIRRAGRDGPRIIDRAAIDDDKTAAHRLAADGLEAGPQSPPSVLRRNDHCDAGPSHGTSKSPDRLPSRAVVGVIPNFCRSGENHSCIADASVAEISFMFSPS